MAHYGVPKRRHSECTGYPIQQGSGMSSWTKFHVNKMGGSGEMAVGLAESDSTVHDAGF